MELLSYAAGVFLTGVFVVQLAQGEVERRQDIVAFERLAQADVPLGLFAVTEPMQNVQEPAGAGAGAAQFEWGEPDTALWAPGRVVDYRASLQAELPPVLGVLEIPSVGLEVPVYSTTTELTMNRGAGIIDGMAYPHEKGNIGISGHRDGYFRVLKDIEAGDVVVLQTFDGTKRFKVTSAQVVEIDDTRLLQDTWDQTLTLVTCYPFYYVGHAPQRFVVTASLD